LSGSFQQVLRIGPHFGITAYHLIQAEEQAEMLIVSGTYRTGTSLMCQVFEEAGFDIMGEKFPKAWKGVNFHLNKEGFYESRWIDSGVNKENCKLAPDAVTYKACKVFSHGLGTTDREYITKVVLMVRDWREQHFSAEILDETNRRGRQRTTATYYPPGYVYLINYSKFLSDYMRRQYPTLVVDYNDLIDKTEETCKRLREFIGVGRFDLGASRVKPRLKTIERRADLDKGFHRFLDRFYLKLKSGHLESVFLQEAQNWLRLIKPDVDHINLLRQQEAQAAEAGQGEETGTGSGAARQMAAVE
jgi:hypothetical protein